MRDDGQGREAMAALDMAVGEQWELSLNRPASYSYMTKEMLNLQTTLTCLLPSPTGSVEESSQLVGRHPTDSLLPLVPQETGVHTALCKHKGNSD